MWLIYFNSFEQSKPIYRYAEASGCAANTGSGVIAFSDGSGYRIYRRLLERDEYSNGTNLSAKTLFSATPVAGLDPNHSSRAGTVAEVDYQDASGNLLR